MSDMKIARIQVVLLSSLAILASLGKAQLPRYSGQPCTAPSGKPGQCLDIHQCPHLLTLITSRPFTPEKMKYLQQAKCGFEAKTPIVCCAFEGPTPESQVHPPDIVHSPATPASGPFNIGLLPFRECGRSDDMRIFGGKATELDEFPWTALLQYQTGHNSKNFGCGGSLISNRYVLTAAHCTSKHLFRQHGVLTIIVWLGEYNKATQNDCEDIPTGGQICADPPREFRVETQIPHPEYDAKNNLNDIALLRLESPVTPFTEYIKPICVPIEPNLGSKTYVGAFLTVTGWGITEKGSQSEVKMKVNVPVVDFEACRRKYATIHRALGDQSGQICAGGQKGKDSCQGDSGGPLMSVEQLQSDGTQRFHLIGITSFGPTKCGMEDWPAVYTRVAGYSGWIMAHLEP